MSEAAASPFADEKRELWGLFRRHAEQGPTLSSRVLDFYAFERLILGFDVLKLGGAPADREWVQRLWCTLISHEAEASMEPSPDVIRWPTLWKVVKALMQERRSVSPSPSAAAFHSISPSAGSLQLALDMQGLHGVLQGRTQCDVIEPLTASPPRHSQTRLMTLATPASYASATSQPRLQHQLLLHQGAAAAGSLLDEAAVSPLRPSRLSDGERRQASSSPRNPREDAQAAAAAAAATAGPWGSSGSTALAGPRPAHQPAASASQARWEQMQEDAARWERAQAQAQAAADEIAELRAALRDETAQRQELVSRGHVAVSDALPPGLRTLGLLVRGAAGCAVADDSWVPRADCEAAEAAARAAQMAAAEAGAAAAAEADEWRRQAAARTEESAALREELSMLHSEAHYRDGLLEKRAAQARAAQDEAAAAGGDAAAWQREAAVLRASLAARDAELVAARESIAAAEAECRALRRGRHQLQHPSGGGAAGAAEEDEDDFLCYPPPTAKASSPSYLQSTPLQSMAYRSAASQERHQTAAY